MSSVRLRPAEPARDFGGLAALLLCCAVTLCPETGVAAVPDSLHEHWGSEIRQLMKQNRIPGIAVA
ncbi:hypothetical protein EG831_07365, partial [bacterium]|nr:hypothetical protein [bacterium]